MGFFTRPDLDNLQFRQESGSTLTLSGDTNFFGILRSKGIEIDATVTGTTDTVSGHVLTFLGGKIILAPAIGSDSLFDSNRPTTRSGIPVVNVGGNTVNEFLEGYFFPAVPLSTNISGGGIRQFGNNAGFTLTWSVTRNTNPITSIVVDGVTIPVIDGNSQTGTQAAVIATPNTNQTYTITAQDAGGFTSNASTTVTFRNKRFFFTDSDNLVGLSDSAISTAVKTFEGSSSEFATGRAKSTFTITPSGEFFYYVIPASFGTPIFTINGLVNNDFTEVNFQFDNSDGFTSSYNLYRTNNILTGTFQIAVS
jgi:hypothetical protein